MVLIDEHNPAVIQKNEELRHTLESSVLLNIINQANPDIHVCMTKMDFLCLAPKTWLTGASIDACSYLFNRREEEKPGTPTRFWFNILPVLIDERKKKENIESIIAEKEIDLEKAKDNPCYDTMEAEWLKEKQKMTYQDSTFFADKCRHVMFCIVFCKVIESSVVVLMVFTIGIEGLFLLLGEVIKTSSIVVFIALNLWSGTIVRMRKSIRLLHFQQYAYTKNLSRCDLAIDLVSYKENRRKQEVFKDCALWSARKPFINQQQKKRKDKEKHLENLRVKRLEKVFLEDENIKKERERHEQGVDDFLNNDLDDSP
ncbi:Lysine--tRNA ligase, partial [Bienertia sinuspersici]